MDITYLTTRQTKGCDMKDYRKMNKTELISYAKSLGIEPGDAVKSVIVKMIEELPDVQEAQEETAEEQSEPTEQVYPAEVEYTESEEPEVADTDEPTEEAQESHEEIAESLTVENAVNEVKSEIARGRCGKFAGAGFFKTDTEGKRTPMMSIIRDVFQKAETKSLAELAQGEFVEKCIVYNAVQNGQVFVRCNSSSRTRLVKAE